MASAINNCARTGSKAFLQVRYELAKLQPVEIDDMNENDIRVTASEGDNATPWVKAKNKDDAIAAWNEANPSK